MNRTLRMWMIWVMAAAAPFFIFPSEAAVWDGPRSHPAAQKVEDAYVYIKYVDIHGRDIYATQTIKGVSGDYANGNDYIRNITTYRFVRTEPGRVQFDAKRRGTIKIVYEKEQKRRKVIKWMGGRSSERFSLVKRRVQEIFLLSAVGTLIDKNQY